MDFASLMKSQISASKPPSDSAASGKKYVSRAEQEAARQAAYQAEQEALEARRVEKLDKKRKLEEEEANAKRERDEKKQRLALESKRLREEEEEQVERARRKRLGLPDLPSKDDAEKNDGVNIVEKLREMGEPIRLFGESDEGRRQRCRRLADRASGKLPAVLTKGPIPTTLVLLPEAQMKIPEVAPKDTEGKTYVYRQLGSYFTMVLEEWSEAMENRDDHVKSSSEGKAALNAMIQARENLRPLFRRMERGDLNDAVLEAVVEIVHAAQERRYVAANDSYLRLSIGKASVTQL
jgi:pre-mRNA-splicing factor 18